MNLKSKRIIPLIIFLVCCALLISQHFSTEARRATFESNRTRYISDILRITNGVMPVLWISPEYSYISTAKYFDLSGNGNHGIQDTVAYQPTVAPPGLSFDGIDDYVDCGSGASLELSTTGSLTLEGWFKIPEYYNISGVNKELIDKRNKAAYWTATKGWNVWHKVIQGYFMFMIGDGTNVEYKSWSFGTGLDSYKNVWVHIVWTVDSSGYVKVYFNGVLKNTQQFTTVNFSNTNGGYNLLIGDGYSEAGTNFLGTIDEVRIYNIALSASQIQALYLAGLPKHRQ